MIVLPFYQAFEMAASRLGVAGGRALADAGGRPEEAEVFERGNHAGSPHARPRVGAPSRRRLR